MKLVVDENIAGVDEFLSSFGQVIKRPGRFIGREDLIDADVLLVRSVTPVNAALLEDTPVRFVASATAGIDHIDCGWLQQQGITFAYAPGCNATAVQEYVLAAIIAVFADRNEDWRTKTVGIVGRGQVGKRLHQCLLNVGVNCLIYDPYAPANDGSDCTLSVLLQRADIITLHTPLTSRGDFPTYHLLGKKALAMMKPDALLINTSRGAVIDTKGLSEHLKKSPLFQVVLDVWEQEPNIDMGLLKQITLGTGHIAGYSLEGKIRGTQIVYEALCNFLGQTSVVDMETFLPQFGIQSGVVSDKNELQQIKALIKQIYDIQADDKAFRKVVENGLKVSSSFDHYRKTYPLRREFGHTLLSKIHESCTFSLSCRNYLSALGFNW